MSSEIINRIIQSDPSLLGYQAELVNRLGQNRVFKLTDSHSGKPSFYAKIAADDEVWGPATTRINREVLATNLVSNSTLVKVPESRIISDPITGQECLIQEELLGESFDLVMSREKDDRKLLMSLAYQSGQTLSQLHQVEGAFFGEIVDGCSGRFETWDECFCAEVERILVLSRKNKILEPNQEAFFTRKLAQGCPRIFSKPVLSHRDYTPQNIITDMKNNEIVGVIDFEVAQFWTQEWDITRTNAFLEYPPENKDLLTAFIKGYAEHQNVDEKSLLEIIRFYKTFESLYYWVWGWKKGLREDINNDIKRVIK